MSSLRILCFGDSLTEGYSGWGTVWTPYADHMAAVLRKAWPDVDLTIVVDGKSGDEVMRGTFVSRLQAQCSKADPPFDWIVILGGTNDLAMSPLTSTQIIEALEKCYSIALDHGAHVLAMTIPETGAQRKALNDRRAAVNASMQGKQHERFQTFDLFSSMPYHSISEEERQVIWDDGVHFTPRGYEILGDRVGQRLVELIKLDD